MELNATIFHEKIPLEQLFKTCPIVTQTGIIRQIYIDNSATKRNEQTDAFLLRNQGASRQFNV